MIGADSIVLFMKGTRDAPQCGFSSTLVQILDTLVPEYTTYDVLSEPEVREGIKEFSEWPTVPQLYVRGEFLGGCDIVRDMYEKGDLHGALGLAAPEGKAPTIEITDEAAQILRDARERSQFPELHLAIDARFQTRLGFAPRQGSEIEVESNGLTLLLDADSATRADGVRVEVADTPQGRGLVLQNPNAG
jgi:monothiol glutaredoxin